MDVYHGIPHLPQVHFLGFSFSPLGVAILLVQEHGFRMIMWDLVSEFELRHMTV